jgi:hypothetical protein
VSIEKFVDVMRLDLSLLTADLPACREGGMTSVLFSVFLLLQTVAPVAGVQVSVPRQVNGRLSVEGNAPTPSSFTLRLMPVGGGTAPSLTIRPKIDETFRAPLPAGEYRVGAPSGLRFAFSRGKSKSNAFRSGTNRGVLNPNATIYKPNATILKYLRPFKTGRREFKSEVDSRDPTSVNFEGRAVTVTIPKTDKEGFFPEGPSTVCIEGARQCYTAPQDHGIDPHVEIVELTEGKHALLFTALSGGVSGRTVHFALLRPGRFGNLVDCPG